MIFDPYLADYEPLFYVSDVIFVRQKDIDIFFKTADDAILQVMDIDSRIELKGGESVKVYYIIPKPYDFRVIAIKKN